MTFTVVASTVKNKIHDSGSHSLPVEQDTTDSGTQVLVIHIIFAKYWLILKGFNYSKINYFIIHFRIVLDWLQSEIEACTFCLPML